MLFICQAMNWQHTYDILRVTAETCYFSKSPVPVEGFIQRDILHNNFITKNEGLRNQIPIQAKTWNCYVAGSESRWPWDINLMKKVENN